MLQTPPVVLTISGHDPSGGAGIQADIEAISHHGCHACSVITALTTQNTVGVKRILPQPAELVAEQINVLFEDFKPSAIKIGVIGSGETAYALHKLILNHPEIPIIIDPMLTSGTGDPLSDQTIVTGLVELLIPLATLITPNSLEARVLAPQAVELKDCGQQLAGSGCTNVLITGTHENQSEVINTLYNKSGIVNSKIWQRLDASYHGSGCTLASSIAAMIALGRDPVSAVLESQRYTWQSLASGYKPGKGQYIPRRLLEIDDQ